MTIPLPPLEEQHRIAQKVDELMALCDQLKERLNQASETPCQLATAVVREALGYASLRDPPLILRRCNTGHE